jgi:hypothetical protein
MHLATPNLKFQSVVETLLILLLKSKIYGGVIFQKAKKGQLYMTWVKENKNMLRMRTVWNSSSFPTRLLARYKLNQIYKMGIFN